MIATQLNPCPDVLQYLKAMASRLSRAGDRRFWKLDMPVSMIVKYVAELQDMGLNCEVSWRLLQESIYPIDATQSHLDRLSISPPQLSMLTGWGDKVPRYIDDPSILLLTPND